MRGSAYPPALEAQRCKIYVAELNQPVPQRKMPKDWPNHQHAFELHLNAAAQRSPWRVESRADADLILAAGNLSLFCASGMTFSRRRAWFDMLSNPSLWASAQQARFVDGSPPVLVGLQKIDCGTPWSDMRGSFKPQNTILLKEQVDSQRHWSDVRMLSNVLISPFVVSRPAWLVRRRDGGDSFGDVTASSAPPHVPWATRKLLFFAGHVPKLFNNDLRYLLWKQLRRAPSVTARSWTIMCTVGSYQTCLQTDAQLHASARAHAARVDIASPKQWQARAKTRFDVPSEVRHNRTMLEVQAYLATHCQAHCPQAVACDASTSSHFDPRAALPNFRRRCALYDRLVNFTDEVPDMARDARRTDTSKVADAGSAEGTYLRDSMSHRFCLVAPGDWWSTKKITETVALGAAGGCLPVLVAPTLRGRAERQAGLGHRLSKFLPYTTWLDYCSIAFLVGEATARTDLASVLTKLAAVSEAEAAAKHEALRRVHDAFVCRGEGGDGSVQAADYVLGAACQAARSRGAALTVAGGDHERCLIGSVR